MYGVHPLGSSVAETSGGFGEQLALNSVSHPANPRDRNVEHVVAGAHLGPHLAADDGNGTDATSIQQCLRRLEHVRLRHLRHPHDDVAGDHERRLAAAGARVARQPGGPTEVLRRPHDEPLAVVIREVPSTLDRHPHPVVPIQSSLSSDK